MALPDKSKGLNLFGTVEHICYSINYTSDMTPKEMVARVPKYMGIFEGYPAEDFKVRVVTSYYSTADPETMPDITPSIGFGLGSVVTK